MLVRRQLKIGRNDYGNILKAVEAIKCLGGVDDVYYEKESRRLHFFYEPHQTSLVDIEAILQQNQIALERGWWNDFKEKHYRLSDKKLQGQ